MIRTLILILLLTTANAYGETTREDTGWELRKNKNDIEVWQREVPGSKYKETKGSLQADISMFAILAVLRDSSACSKWLYKCKHGETINIVNASERVYYTVIDSPLMLKDRDMYIRSVLKYFPDENRMNIILDGEESFAPEQKKRVRVLNLTGSWDLVQQPDGKLLVTYQIHSNPQVSPVGAANKTMTTSVYDTLNNIQRLAQTRQYSEAKFSPQEVAAISISQ